jgi:TolB-like protein/thioredoxin-like negative regulator of GroEL
LAGLLDELKRRNVIRVAVLYVVTGWLLLQAADVGMSGLGLPDWTGKLVMFLLALGLPVVVIFSWVYELTPEGIKREKDVDRSQSVTGETGRKLNIATVVVVILGVGIVLVDRLLPEKAVDSAAPVDATAPSDAEPAGEEAAVQAPAAPGEANSIAVLPFVNMSGDPENEYFADGLTEELLNVLAKMEGLRVAARTSSFRFKGQVGDMAEIGRQLRVGNVLEGSVRKSGNKVRVTAQLIQVADGFHLWSETYDREMDDIFVIQDDIASHVGDALKVTLLGEAGTPAPAAVRAPTNNIEAYTGYLRGQQQLAVNSYDSYEKAERLFREAIELDPNFGAAHSGLAKTWAMMTDWGALPQSETVPRVAAEAQRALDIDDRDPLGWAMRGWAEVYRTDLSTAERQAANEQAEKHLRRALEIEPGHVDASEVLADVLGGTGRPEEALEVAETALSRDLVSAKARVNMAQSLRRLLRFDEAAEQIQLARELEPADPMPVAILAALADARGDYAEAISIDAEIATVFDPRDPEGPAAVARHYLTIGDVDAAAAWARKAESMDPDAPAVRFIRAWVLWARGHRDEALGIARTAFEENLDNRMGSGAAFTHMVLAAGLERGDFDLALLPFLDRLDEALDPATPWSRTAPSFPRANALIVLRARGDDALARQLGQFQLDWIAENESELGEITATWIRAVTYRGLGRVEEALAEYRQVLAMGGGWGWRVFFDFPGVWLDQDNHPALAAFREEHRAWQADQRTRLAESGREPPRPVVHERQTGT